MEKHCFNDLMMGLASSCPECLMRSWWQIDSVLQVHYILFFVSIGKKLKRKSMASACASLVNIIIIRIDPGLALECLEITTSLMRSILGVSTSLCLFCSVGWYILLLVLELFHLSTCTSLVYWIIKNGDRMKYVRDLENHLNVSFTPFFWPRGHKYSFISSFVETMASKKKRLCHNFDIYLFSFEAFQVRLQRLGRKFHLLDLLRKK